MVIPPYNFSFLPPILYNPFLDVYAFPGFSKGAVACKDEKYQK
ncbi:hypothetical protein SD78_0541 [Bacillus badius]|nr:hypothetical protein SD78_0541 [Bacillus badius]